jgi:hypothetical protein
MDTIMMPKAQRLAEISLYCCRSLPCTAPGAVSDVFGVGFVHHETGHALLAASRWWGQGYRLKASRQL